MAVFGKTGGFEFTPIATNALALSINRQISFEFAIPTSLPEALDPFANPPIPKEAIFSMAKHQPSSDNQDHWGDEGILGFPIDCSAVMMHLNQDLRDDWFFDSLLYRDLLENKKSLKAVISELLLEGNGQYLGSNRSLYDIPKKGLGIRYALETDFYDRFIYQALCTFLIPYYDPLLSHRVLGHRYNKNGIDKKYLFKNRIELWRTFEGVTQTAFKSKKSLLATDLINYFENISIDEIRLKLTSNLTQIAAHGKEKLKIRNAISTLNELLTKWSYNGKQGLPQNRDASSFFANIVLSEVDKKMAMLGYDYYRYVDDIRIICENEQHAKKALTDLIFQLRTVGMNINSAKTKILSIDTDKEIISDFFPNTDDRSSKIDIMWRSKSRRVIARSIPLVIEMLNDCISKKETQSRQFRFIVNRFCILIETNLFDIKSALADPVADLVINALENQPASSDQFCRILNMLDLNEAHLSSIENHLLDEGRSIHKWQNYNIWFLFARKKHLTHQLLDLAGRKLKNNSQDAEAPAIYIYLNCVGQTNLLKEQINKFSPEWPHSHQRHFLLATEGLSDEDLKPLVPHLGTKMKGTAHRAKPYFAKDGLPLAESKMSNLLDIYEHISPYN